MGNGSDRRHVNADDKKGDSRTRAEHDRDRIIYSDAFGRLAGVTQVVGAGEGHVFHNRLTHTLEVAQLSLRLAERVCEHHKEDLERRKLFVDPVVAEAAALAHDLGHPPFGHVAEVELNELILQESGVSSSDLKTTTVDGYEGNAQSFRIVTQLAAHQTSYSGLDLTRATQNAMIKYPWMRSEKPGNPKYGAYVSELDDYSFAREGTTEDRRSCEAQIMDHADNIAYSVRDLVDFFRVGLIPLEMIVREPATEIEDFRKYLIAEGKPDDADTLEEQAGELEKLILSRFPRERFGGSYPERIQVRVFGSELIHRLVTATTVDFTEPGIPRIGPTSSTRIEMKFLQRLVWRYVIESERLATQQAGQRMIVSKLFKTYLDAIKNSNDKEAIRIVPREFSWKVKEVRDPVAGPIRLAADIVASYSDAQAIKLFQRITGVSAGSVMDLLET